MVMRTAGPILAAYLGAMLLVVIAALVFFFPRSGGAVLPDPERGRALYERHCLACHQTDGGGVPDMQPALRGSPIVTGAPELLVRWTLIGTPEGRGPGLWANAMPGFAQLSDRDLGDLLTYVRFAFAGTNAGAGEAITPVTYATVAATRKALKAEGALKQ